MRTIIMALVTVAALTGVSASAQNKTDPAKGPAGPTMTVCLDSAGERHSAICSRGTQVGDGVTCSCDEGLTPVAAPVCKAGETPAESSSATSAAMKQSMKTGTLNDVEIGGKRLCVVPRHRAVTFTQPTPN
jgi:hypothetical protein